MSVWATPGKRREGGKLFHPALVTISLQTNIQTPKQINKQINKQTNSCELIGQNEEGNESEGRMAKGEEGERIMDDREQKLVALLPLNQTCCLIRCL